MSLKTMRRGRAKGPECRTLHVVDVENLTSRHHPEEREITATLVDYGMVSGRRRGDLMWLCCSSAQVVAEIALVSTDAAVACKSAGAAEAIDEVLDWGWVARHFQRVTIGSGDRSFAPRMAALAGGGVDVTCVAREGLLSIENRLASHRALVLPKRPLAHREGGAPHAA